MTIFRKIRTTIMALLTLTAGHVQANCASSSIGEESDNCCCSSSSCVQGFIRADLLYWRAFQNGLDSCFPTESSNVISSDGTVISRFNGESKDLHFKWDAGYRLGAGYELRDSGWDAAVYWTYFHSHANRREEGENLNHWKLNYEEVDLIVGHQFGRDACWSWRPLIGVRGARIDQRLRRGLADSEESGSENSSSSFDALASLSSDSAFTRIRNRQDFRGIGPLIGVEGAWNLSCDFSAYAGVALGTLYGRYKVRFNESDTFPFGAEFLSSKSRLHACQAFVDAEIGVRWLQSFYGKELLLDVGLEHHRYFDHNRLGNYGDLCLDGAHFSATVIF